MKVANSSEIDGAVEAQAPGVGNATRWTPTSLGGSKRARVGREWTVGGPDLIPLCRLARTHPVHLQALAAITSDVMRWPLTWARGTKKIEWAPQKLPRAPSWCDGFIHDAIESVGIAGYFAHTTQHGVTRVVPPEDYTVVCSDESPDWQAVASHASESALKLVIVHPPRRDGVRSPSLQSAADTARYDSLEDNLIRRDTRNSEHTVFTSISSDLRNQNGSTRQWFRSALADETAGARPAVDTDFNKLIQRRADTVRDLAMHTQAARSELAAYMGKNKPSLGSKDAVQLMPETDHTEHVITDGRDYASASQLQSLSDGAKELDRVYTQIMLAYQVPPQIFGKNINTERHAASNRLTESAVQLFARYVARIRSVIETVISTATKAVDQKSYVAFRPVVDHGVLERLAPALDPVFVASTVSAAHGVPLEFIQTDKICEAVSGTAPSKPPGAHPATINRKEDRA